MKRGTALPITQAQADWYNRGRTAFHDGQSTRQCPFPMRSDGNSSRYWWMRGWLEARTGVKLEKTFDRLGINWP